MEGLGDLPFHFVSLADEKIEGDPVEDGEIYEENAIAKAEFFGQKTGLTTIADDSGIVVDALKGELGVKTRRWGAGPKATDAEWLDFFLNRLSREENRAAEFICVVALWRPGKETITFRGETRGIIIEKPEVEIEHGIPLSAVFRPDGHSKVYSAFTRAELVDISHRGKAVQKCRDFLMEYAKIPNNSNL